MQLKFYEMFPVLSDNITQPGHIWRAHAPPHSNSLTSLFRANSELVLSNPHKAHVFAEISYNCITVVILTQLNNEHNPALEATSAISAL